MLLFFINCISCCTRPPPQSPYLSLHSQPFSFQSGSSLIHSIGSPLPVCGLHGGSSRPLLGADTPWLNCSNLINSSVICQWTLSWTNSIVSPDWNGQQWVSCWWRRNTTFWVGLYWNQLWSQDKDLHSEGWQKPELCTVGKNVVHHLKYFTSYHYNGAQGAKRHKNPFIYSPGHIKYYHSA